MATSATFLVEVDGTKLPADIAELLTSAYVDSSLRLPDAFMLRFRDPNRIVVEKSKVKMGSTVNITLASTQTETPEKLISAEVTSLEAEIGSPGSFTIIRGYDPAHRLFRGRHTKSYTQATASDAVTQVAQRAKLPAGQIDSSKTVFDHLGQFGQTDWEFLDGLAKRIGYELTMRENKVDFRPREEAKSAPAPRHRQDESACPAAGFGPTAIPVGYHRCRTGRRDRGARLGRRPEAQDRQHRSRGHQKR